jgi:flavodoxin
MSVLIAYGSQTGNAEEIAKQLFEQSKQYQFAKFSCVPQKNIRTVRFS